MKCKPGLLGTCRDDAIRMIQPSSLKFEPPTLYSWVIATVQNG